MLAYLRSGNNLWAVVLAVFSLYIQTLLPLAQAVAASHVEDDGFSNKVLICTGHGVKLIYDARGQEVPPEEGGNIDCPTCMAYAIGMASLATHAEITLPQPPSDSGSTVTASHKALVGFADSTAYQTRAPPALA
jgi:hypothetical protein